MQYLGSWDEKGHDEQRYQQLLSRWDFEELLTELRLNPVLTGQDERSPIIAKEYFAQA